MQARRAQAAGTLPAFPAALRSVAVALSRPLCMNTHKLICIRLGVDPSQSPPHSLTFCVPADGGQRYELVQPFPRRRFSSEDLPRSLRSLGLPQRCLLLLEPLEAPSWSLRGTLAAAAGFMNPVRFLRGSAAGTAGTAGNQPPAPPAVQARERQRGVVTETLPASGSRQQQRGVRKRGGANNGSGDSRDNGRGRGDSGGGSSGSGSSSSRGGGMNGNVHTLGSFRDDAPDGPQNRYSNGNSTSYEARPPPDDQQ